MSSSFRRPTNTNLGDNILYGGADMHVITDMLNGAISFIPPVKFKSSEGVSFWDGVLRFKDVADDSRQITIKNPNGLLASRNLTIPALSANDTLATLIQSQEFTNKTFNLATNTLTATSAVSGEIMVHNGTKFVRLAAGTSVQFLRGDGVWATAPGQGGGEANSAVNVGTAGVGVFKQKTGMDIELKKINAAAGGRITVTDDTTNSEIDLDVNLAGISLTDLGGTLTVAKGGTGATTLTGILKGNGTGAVTAVTAPTGDLVGTTDTQTVTGKTINATNNTITDSSTSLGDILKSNGTKFLRFARGTAGQVLKVNAGGTDLEWGSVSGGTGNTTTLFKNTTTVTVVNTSSETTVLSHSIAGNTIGANGVLHIIIAGWYLNDSAADDQFDMRLKLGGTTIWHDGSGSVSTHSTRRPLFLEIYIKNMNSASVQRVLGTFMLGNADPADVGFSHTSTDEIRATTPIQADAAINTASTQTLAFTFDHADPHASISFNADLVFVELIAS